MPLRVGLLVYPLFILVLMFGKSAGTVSKFVNAGATSEATARKPASVGAKDMVLVQRAEKRGALIGTGDGRYYVNMPRLIRVRKWFRAAAVGASVVFAGLLLVAWHPWTHG